MEEEEVSFEIPSKKVESKEEEPKPEPAVEVKYMVVEEVSPDIPTKTAEAKEEDP
jgi:hypothetical protein